MQPNCKVVFFYAMKKNITLLLILLSVATSFAQSIDDACLYSQTQYQGTAKGLGMGNALGAVGSDMTSISINPAGMGIYRSSEFAMTVGLVDNIHKSTYYDETHSASQWRLSLPNVGYIHAKERSNYRPVRFTQFGITLNRTNDYNMHTYAHGLNPNSSRINDTFLSQIEGINPDDLPSDAWSAWQTYLIDDHLDDIGYYYTTNIPSKVWQSRTSERKGRAEEWNLSGSLNFYDKLFLGASLNINHIKRVGTTTYEESRPQDVESAFQNWDVAEETSSTGWGFNGKLGIIYHANRWLRIGAAFHTPAYYSFDESKQLITESQFTTYGFNSNTQQDNYKFNFFSPLKWVGSFAFVIVRVYSTEPVDLLNMEAMELGESFMEWVEEQDKNGNYPDFGENCKVEKMEILQDMPNLATVNAEEGLARYMIQGRIVYREYAD